MARGSGANVNDDGYVLSYFIHHMFVSHVQLLLKNVKACYTYCRFTGRSDHRIWTEGRLRLPCRMQELEIDYTTSSEGGWRLYYNPQQPCPP